MSSWFETYKPAGSSQFQLLLAAVMWSAVGVGLASAGGYWLLTSAGNRILLMMVFAMCIGMGKSLLILDRAVHRFANRIQRRGEGKCMGGFLSLKGWAMVGGMMLLGRFLRNVGIPLPVLGILYAGVGIGLLVSSRIFWQTWLDHRKVEKSSGEDFRL